MPPADDWRIWLVMAGRGFGKTRLGSEWIRRVAADNPDARIALVGASLGARAVMVEGKAAFWPAVPTPSPRFEPRCVG
jgi:phage terminase large subunit-like protein